MNEDNENKGLAWINTPFSLTKLDKQYTLFQQNVLMLTSTHLQKFVDEYFLEKRQLGDARSDFLFEQGVDHAVMNIPPIKIDIHDFITYENMSYQKLRSELKTSILDMAVKSILPDARSLRIYSAECAYRYQKTDIRLRTERRWTAYWDISCLRLTRNFPNGYLIWGRDIFTIFP